ncbi:MAG TPA: riboflavin synthase [Gammaproteobacteria bacterium]|nr:riboflavin synthase [Gammaproteobacteria bacterium]
MFTGIIQAIGEVTAMDLAHGDARIGITAPTLDFNAIHRGDSIAINGVCLTVTTLAPPHFGADVSGETLARTTFAGLARGDRVNLETAATPASLLGGHLVLGHVDGVGEVVARRDDARSVRLDIELPAALARYVTAKGSVAVDGISLTVNEASDNRFGVNIIPHTLEHTIIGGYAPGTRVNLECDIIARYLERLNLSAKATNAAT